MELTLLSNMSIEPLSGFVKKSAHFIKVDLPAPLDPIIDSASPFGTSKFKPSRTILPLYDFLRSTIFNTIIFNPKAVLDFLNPRLLEKVFICSS
tara:strand:- start:159 stop:440 length:282 start_codon:yes stop_codon:yes gene_type:complete